LLSQNKITEATGCFEEAIRANPKSAELHFKLGNIKKRSNRFEDAIKFWKTALSLDPNHTKAQNNMGSLLLQKHNMP
jgi:tetratricopeptide (TPR) repeat protein